jgi:hypothetical protein
VLDEPELPLLLADVVLSAGFDASPPDFPESLLLEAPGFGDE